MPDPRTGLLHLAPSRARRTTLGFAGCATAALAAVLAFPAWAAGQVACAASTAAAGACALGAAWALLQAWRGHRPRTVVLDHACAVGIGARRIVLRNPGTRVWQSDIVVWRDAVDPARFRRLAAFARWDPIGRTAAELSAEGGKRG